jgi:hypothetical protein
MTEINTKGEKTCTKDISYYRTPIYSAEYDINEVVEVTYIYAAILQNIDGR